MANRNKKAAQKLPAPAPTPEIKTLTVPERAVAALGYNAETVKELTMLAGQSASITAITNAAGYDQCHASRMVLKNRRIEITNAGKTARDDAQKFSKAVIAEEHRLIALIEPEEKRLQGLQDEHDAKIEAEKQARIQAEADRVAAIQERITELRGNTSLTERDEPSLIAEHLADVQALVVDDTFEEFEQQASDAKASGILRLTELFRQATARVEDDKKRAAEQAELEQLRKEKAERDERDRKAAADEQAKRDEIARVERISLAAEEAARAPAPAPSIVVPLAPMPTGTAVFVPPTIVEAQTPAPADDFSAQDFGDDQSLAHLTAPTTVLTFTGKEPSRPSFDDIVETLAVCYATTENVVRSWIFENEHYDERIMAFIGFLSGDIPELRRVEVPKLAEAWNRFNAKYGRAA